MRILLVSQMYPGRSDPDLGPFVAQVERELVAQGHEVERAVIDRRGGPRTKYARLGVDVVRTARRFRPDVIYAHFLVPAGALAAIASVLSGAPLVLTAHGRDVRNIGAIRGVGEATRLTTRRARAVICVSDYLRRELLLRLPDLRDRTHVIDCGVDLDRFSGGDQATARRSLGWEGEGPFYLFVGTLDDRKSPVRLADAFESLGEGRLAFVGDGPLRSRLVGRNGIRLVGRVPPGGRCALDRGLRRPLSAEHDRAVRSGAARGDGERAVGGRDSHRRASRVRPIELRRSRRPTQRRFDRGRPARGNDASEPQPRGSPCRRRARRPGAGAQDRRRPGTGGGISRCPIEQRSQPARPARRASTSGRMRSSRPCSTATASARS